MQIDVGKIRSQQRFAAGQPYFEAPERRRFIENSFQFVGRQFFGARLLVMFRQIDAAVQTVVVAALGEFNIKIQQLGLKFFPQLEINRLDFANVFIFKSHIQAQP